MDNHEWQTIVRALVDTKRTVASAWQIIGGTDGAAPGVGQGAHRSACGFDPIYAIEHANVLQRRRRIARGGPGVPGKARRSPGVCWSARSGP
jgi:hypothetical protein